MLLYGEDSVTDLTSCIELRDICRNFHGVSSRVHGRISVLQVLLLVDLSATVWTSRYDSGDTYERIYFKLFL